MKPSDSLQTDNIDQLRPDILSTPSKRCLGLNECVKVIWLETD
jgi:hypothetical protein